jgi:hypothetical protein
MEQLHGGAGLCGPMKKLGQAGLTAYGESRMKKVLAIEQNEFTMCSGLLATQWLVVANDIYNDFPSAVHFSVDSNPFFRALNKPPRRVPAKAARAAGVRKVAGSGHLNGVYCARGGSEFDSVGKPRLQ